jgi:hypothetical protein
MLKYKYFNFPFYLTIIFLILIIFYFIFKRRIDIFLMFFLYDVYALFGLYKNFEPQYCSNMKTGFNPVMPLEFYADYNKYIFDRIPNGNKDLNKDKIISICNRNFEWLKQNGNYKKPNEIPVFYINEPNFKKNVMYNLKNDLPFVMRGVDLNCFESMRFENLMKVAGNNKVYMSPSPEETCPDNVFTELKNIYKNKCYITNSTNLFYYYKDLLPDSDMDIIKNIIDGYMSNDSKQLFLGVVKGSGTALHAAYTNNFFLMIQGEKKWTFFNPNQLALLYPRFQEKGIYMASESRFLNMDTDDFLDKFPLIRYADRYEIELKERDILYNPMSWFHSVYNLTDISVACSTRWSKPFTIPDNKMLRYGHMINPELRNYVKEIYINTGVIGISHIDEHKHMIGEENPDAVPYWDKYTNDSHKLCKNENCSINWHNNL